MDRDGFGRWLDAYFGAWITNDADDLAALFTEGATYAVGPFAEAWVGREEIVRRWTSGAQEDNGYAYELLAFEGDTGIRASEREGECRWRSAAQRTGRDLGDHILDRRALPRSS